ncbi:putative ABC transporter ATP-binding protein YfmR [Chlamydiales bacterium STE3]|nr:putative ABC transporter ATP-binding protein YfmR [Chlamydiales bacterium STE3]
MTLVGIHSLEKSFGTQTLFSDLSFTIESGDRIGLIGPNGAGKSTLLKILVGLEDPDRGSLSKRQGLRIGYASQDPDFPVGMSLENVLVPSNDIEALSKARILLSKAHFSDFSQDASTLSGGWKKRLDIVRALLLDPDLLLLDEPTNHLDLEGILWLEKFLEREKRGLIVISHDRYFLENVCNKIVEINRCYPQGLFSSEGSISLFMERKEAFLEVQRQEEIGLNSLVKEEIEWLRRSPKARTTKSRSRIQRAHQLIDNLSEVQQRNKVVKADIQFNASERETRKLLTAKNLSKSLGGKPLFKGVDLILTPGSRIGIVGENGTGKTTLLKILAGLIPQDTGTVKYADELNLVYFDQHREQLPENIPLKEALSPTSETVTYRGQSIHVNGWAKKFLFSSDRLRLPVGCLSGGERARILIARLMLKPADILFLDEPTNDLDIPTLEVIEDSLMTFAGAIVLISHDRCLMDRVCTQIIGLGTESEEQFFADMQQWEQAKNKMKPKVEEKQKKLTPQEFKPPTKKLTYNEKRELEGMEQAILKAEQEIGLLQENLAAQSTDAQKSLECYRLLADAQARLEVLFDRWQFLTDKSAAD